MIKVKRVYEVSDEGDGFRILVDRLWPRGVSKKKANIHLWLREVAPSDELRKYFSHQPAKWEAFKQGYREELRFKGEFLDEIREAEGEDGTVTLLYAAKDPNRNNAVVLRELLRRFQPAC